MTPSDRTGSVVDIVNIRGARRDLTGVGGIEDGGSVIARGMNRVTEADNDGDGAIVARIAAGDRDALTELYGRYQRPLFGYLLLLAPDRGTAEEILQDTLVAAWRGAGRFEGRSGVQAWLFGIARRQAHDRLRRRALPRAPEDALAAVPSPEPGPEDRALASASRSEVVAALGAVAPIHREVLVLALGEELSYRELVDVLGVPMGTVKSRLSNAKRALRAALLPHAEGEG